MSADQIAVYRDAIRASTRLLEPRDRVTLFTTLRREAEEDVIVADRLEKLDQDRLSGCDD